MGKFYPALLKDRGARIHITPSNVDWIKEVIIKQSMPQVCLNDSFQNTKVEDCLDRIVSAFDTVFPEKSSYELF